MSKTHTKSKHNVWFWLHLGITILAWVAPFMFVWFLTIPVYLLVWVQFKLFDRCFMNAGHGLEDSKETFYTYLLHQMNIKHNVDKLTLLVRNELYLILASISIVWSKVLSIPVIDFGLSFLS